MPKVPTILIQKGHLFLLIATLLLGFFLRFPNLVNNPKGFFCDEASFEYNAYSILHTGADEYGVAHPLFFKAFGEYKNPVFIYSAIPAVKIFGLNEFSIRITSLIFGLLTILILYLLVKEFFNEWIALISSFLLAISPWHILFSRVGLEFTTALFWTALFLYLFKKSFTKFQLYPLALVALALAFFTYSATKLYLPFLIMIFLIIDFKNIKTLFKKPLFYLITGIFLLIMIAILFPSLRDGTFFARWDQVKMPDMTAVKVFLSYFNYFSPKSLFLGDPHSQSITRHVIYGMGELYLFELPFIIFSIYWFITNIKYKSSIAFFILLLALYPLGGIFTSEILQPSRTLIGVIPLSVLAAFGIYSFFKLIKPSKLFPAITILFIGIVAYSFIHFCFLLKDYPNHSADYWGWQYGPKEIIGYFISKDDNYNQYYLTPKFNQPGYFYKFYDPNYLCHHCMVGDLNNYDPSLKQLFAIRAEDLPAALSHNFVIQKTIYYPNGPPAFYIGTIKP